jgi:transcriptional regulator with XRE-family HTH domain
MLGMYEIAPVALPWDMRCMAANPARKADSERSALRIARRLLQLNPFDSEAKWCKAAGVSMSFFSNLRGTPTKGPSDPSVGKLRAMLEAAGVTLAEFFAEESQGRVTLLPTKPTLEQVIAAALPGRPRQEDRLPEYLAEIVLELLSLPPDHLRKIIQDAENDRAEDALPHAATKRA